MSTKHKISFALIAVLIVIWGVLIIRVDDRWYGIQEAPRIWVPAGIRNYNEYGLETTGLMVIRDVQPTDPDNFEYYSHHPPTIIWMPALFSAVLGFNELAVRIGFIYVTFISVVLFYVLIRRTYGLKIAFWATIFYGLMPMMAYYGRVPGHDQLGIAVSLAFGAVMLNWLKQPNRARLIALIFLAWMAVWTAWTAVFFVGTFGFAGMYLGNNKQRGAIVGFGMVTVIAFIALMLFYQAQWSGSIDSLLDAFVWRSSNASDDPNSSTFTVVEFIITTFVHTLVLTTVGILLMSLGGIFVLRKRGLDTANVIALSLLGGGLIYQLVFRNASYVHDYYKLTFVPVMAISAGALWVYAHQASRKRIIRPIVDSLLIISLISGVLIMYVLHRSGNRPYITEITDWININATDDDLIMTHLDGKDNMMPLRFYTYRVMTPAISLESAIETASATNQRLIYIVCAELDEETAPQLTDDYTTIPADECEIVVVE